MHFQEEMVNFFPQNEALRSESVKSLQNKSYDIKSLQTKFYNIKYINYS